MGDKDFKAGINAFYDFSKVTCFTGEIEKLEALATGMSSDEVIVKNAKTAILLPNDYSANVHGVMEHYQTITANSQIDYQLFSLTEFDNAADFLGFDTLFLERVLKYAFK